MAKNLVMHARIVSAAITGGRKRMPVPPLVAVETAQTMLDLAEEVLRALVTDARDQGHTWQEIGDLLGTSRQAAFQRFGDRS